MALLEEQFTETLDAGAPDITYQGNEGKEQQIARQLWDQLPNEVRMQFGSFQQFFSSGAWKEVLARLQQAQEQTPERIQETETIEEQPQQGLASMMPAQMAGGGDVRLASHEGNDAFLEQRYEYYLEQGFSPRKAAEQAQKDLMEGNYQDMAYGGIAGVDGRRAYGLGSFFKKAFKKVTKPIKKLVKSPLGKAAALGAGAYFAPALFGGTAGFGKGSTWGNVLKGIKAKNLIGPLSTKGEQFGRTLANKALSPLGLGAIASLTPFAMQAAGKWDTGEQDLSNFAEGAWDFDYAGMRKELADAALTGNQDKVDLVLAKYNLSPGDMPGQPYWKTMAQGGRIGAQEGGLMSLGGMEMDLRGGGFVPLGAQEKADDVPARLSKNEFVFTADAVRAAGDGNVDKGADKMYKTMKQLENRVG